MGNLLCGERFGSKGCRFVKQSILRHSRFLCWRLAQRLAYQKADWNSSFLETFKYSLDIRFIYWGRTHMMLNFLCQKGVVASRSYIYVVLAFATLTHKSTWNPKPYIQGGHYTDRMRQSLQVEEIVCSRIRELCARWPDAFQLWKIWLHFYYGRKIQLPDYLASVWGMKGCAI